VGNWVGGWVLHLLANNLTGWKPSGRQPALIKSSFNILNDIECSRREVLRLP